VRGNVVAGPVCPVERPGDSSCAPRPVAGAKIVARGSGGTIAGSTASDATGLYFLPLAPGQYVIEPQPVAGLMGTAQAVTVTVPTGAPLQLDLTYDTGIR
jgi:hypothetical protein